MTDLIGKAIGGKARAQALSPERRKEISDLAVAAKKERSKLPRTICGGEDKKMIFGEIEIQCYVLSDETRVLTQSSLQTGFGMSTGGGQTGSRKIPELMARLAEKGINIRGLDVRANNPIKFIIPTGQIANGYDARILPDICAVLIEADRKGYLNKKQQPFAVRAAMFQHGWATMGIIFLVDKITGYEIIRTARNFGNILESFVVKELAPYVSRFPPEYYKGICLLRNLPYETHAIRRPPYWGHLTNNITYQRIAPLVWKEIKAKSKNSLVIKNPHLHRFLTSDIGTPKLQEVIGINCAVMTLSDDWDDFIIKLEKVLPLQIQEDPMYPQLSFNFNKKLASEHD